MRVRDEASMSDIWEVRGMRLNRAGGSCENKEREMLAQLATCR